MATWKRLTRTGTPAARVDLNLESAAVMQWHGDATTITFAVARAEAPIVLLVKETPEEIRTRMPPLASR